MKSILFFALLFICSFSFGQDTVYYTAKWSRTNYPKIIKFYGIKDYDENGVGMATYYWKDGTLHSHQMEKNNLKHGLCVWYHKNGEKKAEGTYVDDEPEGTYRYYDEKGKLKSVVEYANKEAISEESTRNKIKFVEIKEGDINEDGTVIEFPDLDAQYPGGVDSMMAFLQNNMEYPLEAIINNDQGKVYIKFIVEKDGSLSEVSVERGVTKELDSVAKACVSNMPKWIPGEMNGQIVRTRCRLPIVFTLDNGDAIEEPKKRRKRR